MILGVIPARSGSKGLPGKNLRPLAGVPLIVHTIRAARQSALLGDFLVSTDDPSIADVARMAGAKAPFLRPKQLAGDDMPIWPVVRHAVEEWERDGSSRLEAVVLLQPTSPLRDGKDIDACITHFRQVEADICATVLVAHDSPYFNMVQMTSESGPFVRTCFPATLTHLRRQEAPTVYALNGAVFVVRRSILGSLENQLEIDRLAVLEMPRDRSVDIDSEEDLELAEWILSRRRP